ncbi:hypothetical protein [Streptomyces sp. NBC_01373]|uniref:hypothetical protein n=1 Tax=Streptomyces sp. NBC_01373 TaxID=2903843 RepID=UPI0022511946|nr:hypothetical protein [Streptomyces sp. NBC_01373]MCX4704355.1 hypothetical protein [Streptomyces sp. NBC_01373]MCX4707095.1 hypothetical protein [Streptomyces sp. NBC_01373]
MVDAWATPQQVLDATGVSVTDAELTRAQASIDMFSNRVYADLSKIRARDLYWLRLAVAYQAAWEKSQFDLNSRLDASQVQQDGVVASLGDKAMSLGPRAKQALQRCSWMRSRTIHVRSPFEDGQRGYGSVLSESSDEQHHWTPMGGD